MDSAHSPRDTASEPAGSRRKKRGGDKLKIRASEARRQSTASAVARHEETPSWRMQPWSDWNEWLQMKTLLTKNNHVAARNLLNMFTLRRRGDIPVAMTTSVALVSHLNQIGKSDPYTRRLSLSMAITRFVNGMTDILQPHDINRKSVSVAIIANRLSLPPLLVEIRHQASHSQLPPLSTLEEGARQALFWLDAHYWQAQLRNVQSLKLLDDVDVEPWKETFTHQSFTKTRVNKLAKTGGIPTRRPKMANFSTKVPKNDYVNTALHRMQNYIHDWSQLKLPLASEMTESKRDEDATDGSVWTECGNNKEWSKTPIGLIPGQKFAPRIPIDSLGGFTDVQQSHEEFDDCSEESYYSDSTEYESEQEKTAVQPAVIVEADVIGADEPPLKKLRKFEDKIEKEITDEVSKLTNFLKSDA